MAVHTAQLLPGVADLHPQIRIALVIADFNPDITHTIAEKNTSFLHAQGFQHVDHYHVPGAFELPSLTKQIAQDGVYNLIITIGCLIKGETPHFDVIAQAATQWLTQVSMEYPLPIIFGLLTCNTLEQAQARIDHNYAIYGLNRVAQHLAAEELLETRYNELADQAQATMSSLLTNDNAAQ